jgi:hypothetical protein
MNDDELDVLTAVYERAGKREHTMIAIDDVVQDVGGEYAEVRATIQRLAGDGYLSPAAKSVGVTPQGVQFLRSRKQERRTPR